MNPASRLLPLIESVLTRSGNENKASKDWWNAVLQKDVEANASPLDTSKLSSLLVLLCDQIELLEGLLEDKGVPRDLYHVHFARLREGFSPTMLNERWAATKPNFSAEAIVALRWAEWAVKEEEEAVSEDDLRSLEEQIDALERASQESGIPVSLRRMLRKQVEDLRASIDMYSICGIEPLRKAAKAAMADILIERSTLSDATRDAESPAGNAVQTLGETLSKVVDVVNKAATTSRSVSTLISFGKSGLKLLLGGDPVDPS